MMCFGLWWPKATKELKVQATELPEMLDLSEQPTADSEETAEVIQIGSTRSLVKRKENTPFRPASMVSTLL